MHSLEFAVLFIAQLVSVLEAMPQKVEMPKACENMNFCYETDNYPSEIVNEVVEKVNIAAVNPPKTQHRGGLGYDQPCKTKDIDSSLRIRYIRDTNDDVRYVVQSNEKFMQIPSVVRCEKPGLLENYQGSFDKLKVCRYNVSCVETLVNISFIVLTHDRNDVELATIKDGLPMSCSCEYSYPPHDVEYCSQKQVVKPKSRTGIEDSPPEYPDYYNEVINNENDSK